ncbi:hypothetical protein [Peribacillus kribbensis]|uniref:hypothetical protein n=1 Tax=Peribacillus kribbensis TaxID=356658 RepID=UPI0003FE099E|nr:hypothetical protein [Peribacillus kribbensis]
MAKKGGRRRREIETFLQKEFKKVNHEAKRQPSRSLFPPVDEGEVFSPAALRNEA